MGGNLTNVVVTEPFTILNAAEATRFDYFSLRGFICPIILFDHVHMRAAGFPPHPHAGLAVFSYLFEDSAGSLRDRDSLNDEVLVRPGDLLWFQMAKGMIHEENPAEDGREVNQLQVWINLSPESQTLSPATRHLASADAPRLRHGDGEVKVVLGEFGGAASPLTPTEPFTLLDIDLRPGAPLAVPVPDLWTGLVYVVSGRVEVRAGDAAATLEANRVVGVQPDTTLSLAAAEPARVVYFSRSILDNPPVVQGMFAMASQDAIDDAKRRFHAGEFGHVAPYPKVVHPDRPYIPAGQDPDLTVTPVVERQASVRHYDEGWWTLHLQYCRWEYSDHDVAHGYRFVWEDPYGEEKPYRTGGYIPYLDYVRQLLDIATRDGWGDLPYRDTF